MNYKIIFSFLVIIFFHSCKRCRDNDPEPPLSNNSISFSIIDKNTLEDAIPIIYHPDSLKVLNWEKIDLKIRYNINNDSVYKFYPLYYYNYQTDAESHNNEIIKIYYIYFDKTDTDTLEFRFKTIKYKCYSNFEYLKIKHNGLEILDTNRIYQTHYILIKK